jgi:methionyl-tRNA formyltransferase
MRVHILGEGPFNAAVRERLSGWPWATGPGEGVLGVAANLQRRLSAAELEAYGLGVVGYHPSLLPRHRGPNAVVATVLAGDAVAGGTVYRFDAALDHGHVLAQEWCFVDPDWTPRELYRHRLFPAGLRLLETIVDEVMYYGIVPAGAPQDERFATWHDRHGQPIDRAANRVIPSIG